MPVVASMLAVLAFIFPASTSPATGLHYAVNGNFASGSYQPGAVGFNVADVSSVSTLKSLPAGVKGLVYVGMCDGATTSFRRTIKGYIGQPKLFGFYLMDEPDPTGKWNPLCPQSKLKAESDWIHSNAPGAITFIVLMNMGAAAKPTYAGQTYTPANSHIDLYGLDPYPCRSELGGCDYSYITRNVAAAEAAGIPQADIVPVYQAFGSGAWVDDAGGSYLLPTADQESQILATWASLTPSPVFDYAYSWGAQDGDRSLSSSTSLQTVFAAHNR